MKKLLAYFKEKPVRVLHAGVLLMAATGIFYITALQIAGAEIFAKLVANPDHRMTADNKDFNGLNSDNIRSTHEASDIKDSDFNIIFLGDSFTYGFLMSPEKSPPVQLENLLREKYQRNDINVINFGWTSSSPFLSYRLLQDIGKKYKPDLVLIAVDMSDYRDEWFYKSIIEQRGFYRYVVKFPRLSYHLKKALEQLEPLINWHTQLWGYSGAKGYFVARQPMEVSRSLFDDVYATLLNMNSYSQQELHAPFYTLLPPRHWQYTDKEAPESWENGGFDALGPYALENYRYFDEKRPQTPFPLISFLDDFRNSTAFPLNFKVDSHWNKHGARFFAERVAQHCEALGAFNALKTSAN
jgi:hypothetical protein